MAQLHGPAARSALPAAPGLCLLALALAGAALQAQTAPPAAPFTAAQAARGERVFLTSCAGCHGVSMFDIFAGYRNAYDFHSVVSLTMPWEDEAQLTDQDYIDIVAFMLRETGFAAGDAELHPDRRLLEQIVPSRGGGQ
jgi:mono/diheme cytochrome c family protein